MGEDDREKGAEDEDETEEDLGQFIHPQLLLYYLSISDYNTVMVTVMGILIMIIAVMHLDNDYDNSYAQVRKAFTVKNIIFDTLWNAVEVLV